MQTENTVFNKIAISNWHYKSNDHGLDSVSRITRLNNEVIIKYQNFYLVHSYEIF